VVVAEHPSASLQGLRVQCQGLSILASAPLVRGRLVQQPQPYRRLYIKAPAMVGDSKHVGQQPLGFRPTRDLVTLGGKAGSHQTDGDCRPHVLSVAIKGGADHRLQQPVDVKAVGDDSDQ
jgi:hypothetical protein